MSLALYIVGWRDLFEVRARNGHVLSGPLDWYRAPVHAGGMRQALIGAVGLMRGMAAIGVFDLLCQYSANQPIERRGWLLDPFGRPVDIAAVPYLLAIYAPTDAAAVSNLMTSLIQARWIRWAELLPAVARALSVPADELTKRDPGAEPAPDVRAPRAQPAPEPHTNGAGPSLIVRAACASPATTLRAQSREAEQAEAENLRGEKQAPVLQTESMGDSQLNPASAAAVSAGVSAAPACSARPHRRAVAALTVLGFARSDAEALLREHPTPPDQVERYAQWGLYMQSTAKLRTSVGAYVRQAIRGRYESVPRGFEAWRAKRLRAEGER